MTPTLSELKAEIQSGLLASECAAWWSDVFDDPEPLRTKLAFRQGLLKPDAAFEIHRILSDSSKRTKANKLVSRGVFLASLAPLSSVIATLPETAFKAWSLVIQMAVGGDDTVNLARPSIVGLFDSAVSSGLITEQQKDAILSQGGTTTQSRFDELGWSGVTTDMIQQAKAVV